MHRGNPDPQGRVEVNDMANAFDVTLDCTIGGETRTITFQCYRWWENDPEHRAVACPKDKHRDKDFSERLHYVSRRMPQGKFHTHYLHANRCNGKWTVEIYGHDATWLDKAKMLFPEQLAKKHGNGSWHATHKKHPVKKALAHG